MLSTMLIPEHHKTSLKELAQMDNDTFLATWETALEKVKTCKNEEKHLPYYTVHRTKESKSEMTCQLLEYLFDETNTDQDLAKLLTSSGLRKEIVNIIIAESEHLRNVISSRRFQKKPREELVDLQWKFGVVAGSSSEGEAGKTFVQVKLVSKSPSGAVTSHHVEMSLNKFYDFLHQLEKAKATLEYMNFL